MKADGTFLCYWIITEKMFMVFFFFTKMCRFGRAMKNETQTQIFSADGRADGLILTSDILLLDYCPKMSKTT